ncbi:hypothetical protein LCGC14_1575730, partial [marine sediment metagenome]
AEFLIKPAIPDWKKKLIALVEEA